ncbi:hypothetical protein AB0M11_33635 [Streptomyces sp. NPDC051987]|uniref:DUF7848 domain-containing protein n=1 Tax=Streptomyces sp. NPDC051987 TaxID=3155808 RepID=UPI00342472C9
MRATVSLPLVRETSPTSEDFAEPQDWVLRHCGQNPSHHTYREIIIRPLRAWRQT